MIGPTPLLDFFKRGEVARDVRLSAAKGELAPRAYEQLAILTLLVDDKEQEIRDTAEATLGRIPSESLRSFLGRPDTPAGMLEFFADRGVFPDAIPQISDDDSPLIDTEYIPEFDDNQLVPSWQKEAADEAAAAPATVEAPAVADVPAAADTPVAAEAPAAVDAPQAAAPPDAEAAVPDPAAATDEEPATPGDDDEIEAETDADGNRLSASQQLAKMGMMQKLKAAVKGTREMRSILIRDPNKMICAAVLSSPKLTDSEIASYAKMQNVSEDVLRVIAANRSWTKSYTVVLALVKNPKTPVAMSINFLQRLTTKDVAMLAVDRNVSEALRISARKKAAANRMGGS